MYIYDMTFKKIMKRNKFIEEGKMKKLLNY